MKKLNTSLKPSVKGYPEILQKLKNLNNQNQIMKEHHKNVVTKQKKYQEKNTENYLLRPTFQFKRKSKRGKKCF